MDDVLFRDELPYGPEIAPGVMMLTRPVARHNREQRQYALCICWDIRPRNIDLVSDLEADELAGRFANMIRQLPPKSTVDVRLDSRPLTSVPAWEAHREHLNAPHVEWQRAHIRSGMPHTQNGRSYTLRENLITVAWRQPAPLELPASLSQYLRTAMVWRHRRAMAHFDQLVNEHVKHLLDAFVHRADAFETAMVDFDLHPVRLTNDALLNRLARQLDPTTPPLSYEDRVPLRDQIGSTPVRLDPDGARINGRRAYVIQTPRGIGRTFPGILSATRAPERHHVTTDFSSISPTLCYSISVAAYLPPVGEVINTIQSRQSFAWIQRIGGRGQVRSDIDAQAQELSDLLEVVTSGRDSIMQTGVRFICWDDEGTETNTLALSDRLQGLGMTPIIEREIGHTLFLQSMSAATDYAYPRADTTGGMPATPASHTASLMPIWGSFRGLGASSADGILLLNRAGDPVFLNPFDAPGSPHGIVTGRIRSGKSAVTNVFINQTHPLGARTYILDRYRSYEQLCVIQDGVHYAMDMDNPICFGLMDGPLNAGHRATVLAALMEMCGSGESGTVLERTEQAILTTLLSQWVRELTPECPRTLTHFVESFDRLAPNISGAHDLCHKLTLLLSPYYGDGEYARFVDGPNEINPGDKRLVSVDIAGLREMREIESVAVALFFMRFGEIIRDPALRTTPKFLIADEVAFLLQSPSTAKFFVTLARALARFQCSLITITQLMSDFNSEVGEVITGMSGFRIMFRLPNQEATVLRAHGLGPKHEELIFNLERSHNASTCYLSTKNGDEGVVRVVAPPEFITAIGQDMIHQEARRAQEDAS